MERKLHTLILTVEDKPGVLFRISGLIRKRQFNIDSLTVSHTTVPGISRFTILVNCDVATVEKMSKQLSRIIEVLEVKEGTDTDIVARELALLKVAVLSESQGKEIEELCATTSAKILQRDDSSAIIEVTGSENEIDWFKKQVEKFGIIDFVRTGRTALFA